MSEADRMASDEALSPAELRARDAVRALPPAAADPAFRARLREDFVSGALAYREARAGRGVVVAGPRISWVPTFAWAAAAAVLVAAVIGLNAGPRWRVTSTSGEAIAVVDQRPIPLGHVQELAAALHPGARITVPEGGSLVVTAGKDLMVQVTHGTDLVMPAVPGRWFGRGTRAEVRTGEIRITTGPQFHGARLAVMTPEAHVEVTGTTLAVICEPTGTCVCVLQGRVAVGPREGAMEMVTSGHRRYVFRDGRPPEMAEMRTTERAPLTEIRSHFTGEPSP